MLKAGSIAVVHYTGKLEDGAVFDSSEGLEPLRFEIGQKAVVPGFEEAVVSMKPGECKTVIVPPEKAFGFYDDGKIETAPMLSIPNAPNIKIGVPFHFFTEDGLPIAAKVLEVDDEGIAHVDFNLPLAGHTLTYEIRLLEIVPPEVGGSDETAIEHAR